MKREILVLSAAILALAGCEKTYTLQFKGVSVPDNQQPLIVQYDREAKSGDGNVGMIAAGQTLTTKYVIEDTQLPGTVNWSAGPIGGKFPLSGSTQSPLVVIVNQQQVVSPSDASPDSPGTNTKTPTEPKVQVNVK